MQNYTFFKQKKGSWTKQVQRYAGDVVVQFWFLITYENTLLHLQDIWVLFTPDYREIIARIGVYTAGSRLHMLHRCIHFNR